MGIRLTDNFAAPYYSKNIREFWRRWHISLSGWFRDYLYIPLGGSRKGMLKKEGNRLIVFAVSGLWHGASLGFVFWGVLNGIYQVIEDVAARIKQATVPEAEAANSERFSRRLFRMIFTFGLVSFGWLFFRAGSLGKAYEILTNMFSTVNLGVLLDGSLYELGVERKDMNILLASITVLFIVDYHKYRDRDVVALVLKQGYWFRYLIYAALFFIILICGCYGDTYDAQQFIYFQF